MRSLWVRVRSGRLVTRGGGSYPSVARPHAMPPGPPHGRPANDFRAKAPSPSTRTVCSRHPLARRSSRNARLVITARKRLQTRLSAAWSSNTARARMARSTSSAMELKLWASLVGSAVLMLESGVRRRLPDDFRSLWRAARVGLQFFFLSRVKPVLSESTGAKRYLQRRRRQINMQEMAPYSSST